MSGKLSCIIAASVLILMIGAILANAIYIKNTTNYILTQVNSFEDLTDYSGDAVTAISEYWNKRIPILKLSLSQKELEEITLMLDESKICVENKDTEEYKRSMARLKRAIEGIRKREEFSIDNIF